VITEAAFLPKFLAVIQIVIVLLVIGFSTYQLFQGHFEVSLGILPLLMVYYVFVTARRQRRPKSKE
jgi:hypothetical protein